MPRELHDKAVQYGVTELTELARPGTRIQVNSATLTRMASDYIYLAQGRPEEGTVNQVSQDVVQQVSDSLLQQAPLELK